MNSCDMSLKRHLVKTLVLKRLDPSEDWGFGLSGSWQDGEWISKFLEWQSHHFLQCYHCSFFQFACLLDYQ